MKINKTLKTVAKGAKTAAKVTARTTLGFIGLTALCTTVPAHVIAYGAGEAMTLIEKI